MSTEKLDKYKELHSEFILHFVDLHNYQQVFLEYPSYASGAKVRKAITHMIRLGKEMRKISIAVSSENKRNVKAGHMADKNERARLKAIPKKVGRPRIKEPLVRRTTIGRPRKNKNDNNTTK